MKDADVKNDLFFFQKYIASLDRRGSLPLIPAAKWDASLHDSLALIFSAASFAFQEAQAQEEPYDPEHHRGTEKHIADIKRSASSLHAIIRRMQGRLKTLGVHATKRGIETCQS